MMRRLFASLSLALIAWMPVARGQATQQTASPSCDSSIDLSVYPNIQILNVTGSSSATLGTVNPSDDGTNGSASVTAYNIYKGPNGNWWAAHVHSTWYDDDNGDGSTDSYAVDLGSATPAIQTCPNYQIMDIA